MLQKNFIICIFRTEKDQKKQRVHGKGINDANNLQNQCRIITAESTVLSITIVFAVGHDGSLDLVPSTSGITFSTNPRRLVPFTQLRITPALR